MDNTFTKVTLKEVAKLLNKGVTQQSLEGLSRRYLNDIQIVINSNFFRQSDD